MKLVVFLIGITLAVLCFLFLRVQATDLLQPFRDAVGKIEVTRDRNAEVVKPLGMDIHDVRPGGVTENAANSGSKAGPQNIRREETPFPERRAASLLPVFPTEASANAAAAEANAATRKAFNELR